MRDSSGRSGIGGRERVAQFFVSREGVWHKPILQVCAVCETVGCPRVVSDVLWGILVQQCRHHWRRDERKGVQASSGTDRAVRIRDAFRAHVRQGFGVTRTGAARGIAERSREEAGAQEIAGGRLDGTPGRPLESRYKAGETTAYIRRYVCTDCDFNMRCVMHQSKRWIRTYDGRLKRSSNRTVHDALGDVVRPGREWSWIRFGRDCRDCRLGYRIHGYRYICQVCLERHDACRRVTKERDGWGQTAPRWFRNIIERKSRARVRSHMAHGRYEALPIVERPNGASYSYF